MSIAFYSRKLRGWQEAMRRFATEEIPIPKHLREPLAAAVRSHQAELDLIDSAIRESERIERAKKAALREGLEATK